MTDTHISNRRASTKTGAGPMLPSEPDHGMNVSPLRGDRHNVGGVGSTIWGRTHKTLMGPASSGAHQTFEHPRTGQRKARVMPKSGLQLGAAYPRCVTTSRIYRPKCIQPSSCVPRGLRRGQSYPERPTKSPRHDNLAPVCLGETLPRSTMSATTHPGPRYPTFTERAYTTLDQALAADVEDAAAGSFVWLFEPMVTA